MLEDVIDQILHEMDGEIKHISENYKDATEDRKKKMYGDIGEMFVGRAIKFGLMDFGFDYGHTDTPCSFRITRQYGADSNGLHGVDFKVDIRDGNNQLHTYLIESKNWSSHYEITPKMFLDEILPRFQRCDSSHQWNWCITMNKRNIPKIAIPCVQNRIGIIPLTQKYTESSDINKVIKPAIKCFIVGFYSSIRKNVNCEKRIKPTPDAMNLQTKTDKIKYYVRQNYPDKIIKSKFNISQRHLSKIKNQLKKDGVHIMDRRSKEAKDDKLL